MLVPKGAVPAALAVPDDVVAGVDGNLSRVRW